VKNFDKFKAACLKYYQELSPENNTPEKVKAYSELLIECTPMSIVSNIKASKKELNSHACIPYRV
jgi:hypothetical protein